MHNYLKKLQALVAAGKLPSQPGLSEMCILHDDWCAIYSGGECNCDPDITFTPGVTVEEHLQNLRESSAHFAAHARGRRQ